MAGKYGEQQDRQRRRDEKASRESDSVGSSWSPPPKAEWDPSQPATANALSGSSRIITRFEYCRNRLVEYAIIHETRIRSAWHEVAKADTAHEEIHRHSWHDGRWTRDVIKPITAEQDVSDSFDAAYMWVLDNWEENEQRWKVGHHD